MESNESTAFVESNSLKKACSIIGGRVELPRELFALLTTLKIPNALLFVGNKGLEKIKVAHLFARSLNCKAEKTDTRLACNGCRSCKKMLAGAHPDIISVASEKDRIKIAQIREIYGQIKAKPHEAKFRMVLIQGADTMNQEASNALLKILEEPPERTFFVLTAERTDTLLPTILSRCRQVNFLPMDQSRMEEILINEHRVDKNMAKIAASLARGSLKKALKFADVQEYGGLTDTVDGTDATKGTDGTTLDDLINLPKMRGWIITAIASLINGNNPETVALALAERLSKTAQTLGETLSILESFLRDIAVFKHNPGKIINSDFQTLIAKTAPGVSSKQALDWIEELSRAEKKIKANAGIRLTLEAFLFRLLPIYSIHSGRRP
jgi:DNA polymerase-3 subunit delta'